jgi:precorrin-2 methylase
MDEKDFRKAVKRLHEVNKVVVQLDPAIRSQAFDVLRGYVTEVDETEMALLQQLMDEKSKLEEMIANVMKTISDAQEAIVKNLK